MYYRHWRTKEVYKVVDPKVTDTDTGHSMVYYRDKYGQGFVRPSAEFYGFTEDGTPRYELVGEVCGS